MSGVELILIRHGESEWNVRGLWQGQADPPLTDRGRSQARAAVEAVSALEPVALYASDLVRAWETAEIVGRGLALEPQPEPRVREFHVGEWSGCTKAEIDTRWPGDYERFRNRELDFAPGGGETPRALMQRVDAALRDIAASHAAARATRVAVVTHGGVVRSLCGVVPGNAELVRVRPGGEGTWDLL
jgi:broad specificity phosphatase PhoE